MPTSSTTVTDAATGTEVATETITEDALTKHIQRLMADNRLNAPTEKYMALGTDTPGARAITLVDTNIAGIRKLAANPDVYITRIEVKQINPAAGTVVPIVMYRASTVAGGTMTTAASYPEIETAAGNSTLQLRRHSSVAGEEITGTIVGDIMWTFVSGGGAVAAGYGMVASVWAARDRSEWLRLTGDEGLLFRVALASDTDNRYYIVVAWEELS